MQPSAITRPPILTGLPAFACVSGCFLVASLYGYSRAGLAAPLPVLARAVAAAGTPFPETQAWHLPVVPATDSLASISAPTAAEATPVPAASAAPRGPKAASPSASPAPTASAGGSAQAAGRAGSLYVQAVSAPTGLSGQALADWQRLAAVPQALWLGGWSQDVTADAKAYLDGAAASGTTGALVLYNIPDRDCGSYSAGGASGEGAYKDWIDRVAAGIAGRHPLVIVEPDSLGLISCLDAQGAASRYGLLGYAVRALSAAGAKPYLDAGHSSWVSTADMAGRLRKADVASASGFALNVSNFQATADEVAYGTALSKLVGGAHFVIDTSRNGSGAPADGSWCNPPGRTVGSAPTLSTGLPLVDAYLWIKHPGESDGQCNGGPSAGTWWSAGARALLGG